MRLGKLDNDTLETLVLNKFRHIRPEALTAPRIGEDCTIVDLMGDLAVLSTDPITSAASHIGRLSVHVNCNDAAAAGADPVGLLVTLLAPPDATLEQIAGIADELSEAAQQAGVDVLGGHTEVTDAVTRIVANTTVLARLPREGRLPGMQPGNALVMTKWAGLEGSAVIVSDHPEKLNMLSKEQLDTLRGLTRYLSVVPEGRYGAAHGATAMHDVTEGGVLGAAWEMAYTAGLRVVVDVEKVPVLPETRAMCELLGLDPFRLLASGSMLISCPDGEKMVQGLKEIGIPAACIGYAEPGEGVVLSDGTAVAPPEADELYRLFP